MPVDCLAPGAEVEILGNENGWARVRTGEGSGGWVTPLYLELPPVGHVQKTQMEEELTSAVSGDDGVEAAPGLPQLDSQPVSSEIPIEPTPETPQTAEPKPVPLEPLAPPKPLTPMEPLPVVDPVAEVEAAIRSWAGAWASQDVEGYLGAYAHTFSPPESMRRTDWEQLRRERLSGPASIEVTISDLQIVVSEPDRVITTFVQAYDADTFSDVVTKSLELVLEEGRWKIELEEVVE